MAEVVLKDAIPETSEELNELLMDEKRMGEIWADPVARADFLEKYTRAVDKKRPDIQRMINDGVERGLRAFMLENGINRPDLNPTDLKEAPRKGAAYNKRALGAAMDKEFDDTVDFLHSIWHGNLAGRERWRKISNDYSSLDPSSGGFLVPEFLRSELLRVALETAVVRSRARVIPMDSNRVPFPMINDSSHASSVFGGVTASWTEEGASLGESEAAFGRVMLTANKLASRCDVPNELLQDSIISFSAFINDILPQAIAWYEDDAFLNGTGVGQPAGVLNAANGAIVSVAKETGQAATTIVWENLVKMYSRMLPSSINRAVWVAHIDTFPELATMALSVGTGGSAIWLTSGVGSPPASILGRPLIFSEKMQTLGTTGDIAFVDFGYYLVGDRMQMRAESSAHAQFTTDQTVYRIIERVDGRPWLPSAITPANGSNTLSPYITLATRA